MLFVPWLAFWLSLPAILALFGWAVWPLPPRLKPHDIPVMVLEDGILTEDALRKLLSHECCAVHMKGFVDAEACAEIASRLAESAAFSNWMPVPALGCPLGRYGCDRL